MGSLTLGVQPAPPLEPQAALPTWACLCDLAAGPRVHVRLGLGVGGRRDGDPRAAKLGRLPWKGQGKGWGVLTQARAYRMVPRKADLRGVEPTYRMCTLAKRELILHTCRETGPGPRLGQQSLDLGAGPAPAPVHQPSPAWHRHPVAHQPLDQSDPAPGHWQRSQLFPVQSLCPKPTAPATPAPEIKEPSILPATPVLPATSASGSVTAL